MSEIVLYVRPDCPRCKTSGAISALARSCVREMLDAHEERLARLRTSSGRFGNRPDTSTA